MRAVEDREGAAEQGEVGGSRRFIMVGGGGAVIGAAADYR